MDHILASGKVATPTLLHLHSVRRPWPAKAREPAAGGRFLGGPPHSFSQQEAEPALGLPRHRAQEKAQVSEESLIIQERLLSLCVSRCLCSSVCLLTYISIAPAGN